MGCISATHICLMPSKFGAMYFQNLECKPVCSFNTSLVIENIFRVLVKRGDGLPFLKVQCHSFQEKLNEILQR